ncbi:MAG TPA: hypothetical protein VN934_11785 [Candidatus Tumulicola sp.]|nr:hypothetical protein [Candidatus Tumulicola sp.]
MYRKVSSAAGLLAAALLIIVARPAAASVTTATLTATTPSYSGKCPVTEAFTGAISGTPGTTFQYSFNRYINGVQQVQNVGAGTIPSNGTFSPVNDSFSIASSSTGTNFDQIWVHNIAGGQADVYSNKASFTATCVLILLSTMPPIPVASPPFSSKNQVTQPLSSNATLVLHPGASAIRSKVLLNQGQADFFFGPYCTHSGAQLCVGYDHVLDTGVFGEKKIGIIRSYFMFAIPHGLNVVKALLGFHQIFDGTDQTSFQCFGGIAPAVSPWTTNNDFVDGDFGFPAPAHYIGPDGTIDVTSIVKAWTGKMANNGFVMRGSDEQTFIGKNETCHFIFSPIELKITVSSPILKVP